MVGRPQGDLGRLILLLQQPVSGQLDCILVHVFFYEKKKEVLWFLVFSHVLFNSSFSIKIS